MSVLCALAVQYLNDVAQNLIDYAGRHFSPGSHRLDRGERVALVALQLRHSWPSRGARLPRGWQVTLGLQVLFTYAMVPVTGWRPLAACGFLAGSALLLLPAPWGRIAFAAVIASVPVFLTVTSAYRVLTPLAGVGAEIYLTLLFVVLGLLVYGLTRLAWLAVQLEDLRAELARKAVLGERLRVARDTHDLLGLGLAAIAMKADLIGRLHRPRRRQGGHRDRGARADLRDGPRRHAPGDRGGPRPAAGRRARGRPRRPDLGGHRRPGERGGGPGSGAAAAVLVPVVREAVTNVLKHSSASYCVLEMTAATGCCGC